MGKTVENYMIQESIGEGNFSKVFKAKHVKTGEEFAVKVIPAEKFKDIPKLEECTVNEIKILSKIRNESDYIVKYIDMLKTTNNFYFVYEFCNGGTLDKLIQKEGPFPEHKALKYLKQILEGFKVLNKCNIMHRDLKPENILLHNGNIKLADFSFCKLLENKNDLAQTMLGSPIYMAPEVLKGQIYTMKADIWSMGIVLYKMLFGKCPYESKSIAMLIKLLEKQELQFPADIKISPLIQQLLRKVLVKDPNERLNWDQIFSTYYITDYGQLMSNRQDNQIQTHQSQLRSSMKVNPNMSGNMRNSYPNNVMGFNPNMTSPLPMFQGNLMTVVSPKSTTQIIQIPNHNRSYQPYNEGVQSPVLDKNMMITKKSPYKIHEQRNTADYKNIPHPNHSQTNGYHPGIRSTSISSEMNGNFYHSQQGFKLNSQTSSNNGYKLNYSSQQGSMSKDMKNSGPMRAEILLKIHEKCIQVNQICLESFNLEQNFCNYIGYLVFKTVCKEIQILYENVKKESPNQMYWREFKNVVETQLMQINKTTASFYEAILQEDKEVKLLNQRLNKSLDDQLHDNKQRILKMYVDSLQDSDEQVRLGSQVVDYLTENMLMKRQNYQRQSRDQLLKHIRNKVSKE